MSADPLCGADVGGCPVDWPGAPRYEFVRYIGRGGAGVVYEALDHVRGRSVALKTIANFSPDALYRFKQEFRTLADVRHAGLVRLYEFVAPAPGRAFFTMELVRGNDFRRYTRRDSAPPARLESMRATTRPQRLHSAVASDRPPPRSFSLSPSPISRSPANFTRLRSALIQLVRGVRALHAAGKLHRDIKPSNVLVTHDGRVVLLDFGIATELAAGDFEQGLVLGTPEYMAPEQAAAAAPRQATDWYAVGAMLFDAMVGSPPFTGEPADVIRLKVLMDAPDPSALVAGVPADLNELCAALLDRSPERRPSGDEILRALGAEPSVRPTPEGPLARTLERFVGREQELAALERAFSIASEGTPVAVRLRGGSGHGKSALIQHFAEHLSRAQRATVLRARAYEHESIPYKAADGLVDALSRHLKHREERGESVRVSRKVSALACLFPALRRVEAVAKLSENPRQDPLQTRQLAFAGLRELVSEVSAGRPIVLCIDDAQWGDVDSVGLLLELVDGPAAPATLIVFVHRDVPSETSPFLHELSQRWPKSVPLHDIEMGTLGQEQLRQLVLSRLEPGALTEVTAEAISREAAGNPFLALELACSARQSFSPPQAQDSEPSADISIGWLVKERIADLDDGARRVLELVALSGRPLKAEVVAAAAGASDVLDQTVAILAQRRLIGAVQRDGEELLMPRHDRIREAIVARIPKVVSRAHHQRLAEAIEAMTVPDVEALVTHWLEAGESARAGRAALTAAEYAADKLAFKRAEELYRIALTNAPNEVAEAQLIRKQLAQVLEWDGRGVAAARVYLEAASCSSGIERSELESAGAMQLLYSGRVGEGVSVLRSSLAALGLRLPRTLWSALVWRGVYGVWRRLVAPRAVERPSSELSDMARARVEALYTASFGLMFIDPLMGSCMQSQHLVVALREGHSLQQARALSLEACQLAGGSSARTAEISATLFRRAEALAGHTGQPSALAFIRACRGVSEFLLGNFARAHALLENAYEGVPRHRAGWHTNAWIYDVLSLTNMGEFDKVSERLPTLLQAARERGDLFTLSALRFAAHMPLLLAQDCPAAAREHLLESIAERRQPGSLLQRWCAIYWAAEVELYAGRLDMAFKRYARHERRLEGTLLFRIQYVRAMTHFLRARCAIGTLAQDRRARRRQALQSIRRLERDRVAWTSVLASMASAALLLAEGDTASAIVRLRAAIRGAQSACMLAHADACRLQLGTILSGAEATEMIAMAEQGFQLRGVRHPRRFTAMFFPGGDAETRTPHGAGSSSTLRIAISEKLSGSMRVVWSQ